LEADNPPHGEPVGAQRGCWPLRWGGVHGLRAHSAPEMKGRSGLAVADAGLDARSTAVVVDPTPLLRLGLAASLRLAGVATVADADDLSEGVAAARQAGATLLVLGGAGDAVAPALARRIGALGTTRVVVLVSKADRNTLVTLPRGRGRRGGPAQHRSRGPECVGAPGAERGTFGRAGPHVGPPRPGP
jgi:hypothetical protein